jgi:hypothetical protein
MSDSQAVNPVELTVSFLKRFVFLEQDSLYKLLALWIISTYFTDRFEYTGYIFAHSVRPQSGKSRLLEILNHLVCKSSGILIRPTPAILFRTAHGHTQLLDEVDAWTNSDELRGILNAGFRRGAQVARMGTSSDKSYKIETFPVFAPRALAGIGANILDSTTKDRTFAIEMVSQPKEFRRERLRMTRAMKAEIAQIKWQLENWGKERRDEVTALYENETAFPYLEDFQDRTIDVAQPLAAVLEVAYKADELLEAEQFNLICAIAHTRTEDSAVIDDFKVLRELNRLTANDDPLIGTASELAERCIGLATIPEEITVSRTLRKFGFDTKSTRRPDGMPKYRYCLPRSALTDVLRKYAVPASNRFTL